MREKGGCKGEGANRELGENKVSCTSREGGSSERGG